MRADRPLFGAVIFLGLGLGLIIGYCQGTTGFNAAFPLAGSTLHVELTTTGPAVIGGIALTAIGALLLVWAFLVSIASLFTRSDRTIERIYSVAPQPGVIVDQGVPVVAQRKHFWSRPSTRTTI